MFVDTAEILVTAGSGGDGCLSFFRSAGMPKGGPDGGNGGRGGSVIFRTDLGLNTLVDFRGHHHWTAGSGEPGRGKQQHGKGAEDLIIKVPPGTLIYDDDEDQLLADLGPGDEATICKGGAGGLGNEHFKSPTNQAPRKTTRGEQGERRRIRLELKLIAEVGLVGLPNAGKSTLLKAVSRADPKIASYPFTTLTPQLGIAAVDESRRIVIADIPGLIEGAADGHGLGHDFLRHVERTRVILHVIDAVPTLDEITGSEDEEHELSASRAADSYHVIRGELAGYASALAEKPEVLAFNKLDLLPSEDDRKARTAAILKALELGADTPVCRISGAAGIGITEMLEAVWSALHPAGTRVSGWQGINDAAPAPDSP